MLKANPFLVPQKESFAHNKISAYRIGVVYKFPTSKMTY